MAKLTLPFPTIDEVIRGIWRPPKPVERPEMESFPKFPAEIQQMVWVEAMQKPSCHTFKFVQRKAQPETAYNPSPNTYALDLAAIPANYDTSSYRHWKGLLWCQNYKQPLDESQNKTKKPSEAAGAEPELEWLDLQKFRTEKANLRNEDKEKSSAEKSIESFSKLANASFQAGFRRSMVQLEAVRLSHGTGVRDAAAIDVETDLVILEFERGETARPYSWFEHTAAGTMDMDSIRHRTRQLKRVAVHWKNSHAKATKRGPFQCWCPNPPNPPALQCNLYKACPAEQACFLDCFANLEEFYYVVEVKRKTSRQRLEWYREHARRMDYKLETSADKKGPKFHLSHFYDQKFEYLQLCPRDMNKYLPGQLQWPVRDDDAQGRPRDCLMKVRDIYKGRMGKDDFNNPLEQRKKVKFGILVTYKLEE